MHDLYLKQEEEFEKMYSGGGHIVYFDEIERENIKSVFKSHTISLFEGMKEELEGKRVDTEDFELDRSMEFGRQRVVDYRIGLNEGLDTTISLIDDFIKMIKE